MQFVQVTFLDKEVGGSMNIPTMLSRLRGLPRDVSKFWRVWVMQKVEPLVAL